jgi:hypothetical protein
MAHPSPPPVIGGRGKEKGERGRGRKGAPFPQLGYALFVTMLLKGKGERRKGQR